MPGERRVLERFFDGASVEPFAGLRTRVQADWLARGLPVTPVDGEAGQQQIRTLAARLRSFSVEASALLVLEPWEGGVRFIRTDEATSPGFARSAQFDDLTTETVSEWVRHIDVAVTMLLEFAGDGGD